MVTPAGSPMMACPPYSSNPTVTNIGSTTATFSTIPFIGSYDDSSVTFRVVRYDVWDSFFFAATPSPVTSNGTTVSVNATSLPAGSSYYYYPIITYGGGRTVSGQSNDFSTSAQPTQYILSTTIVGKVLWINLLTKRLMTQLARSN